MNGVLNLSVLDGWWPEGFDGSNGWAIEPLPMVEDLNERNSKEARELYNILEEKVVPLYFETGEHDFSESWVKMSKRSMQTILPQFNAQRMVMDYIDSLYMPSWQSRRRLMEKEGRGASELAGWKRKIRKHWDKTSIRQLEPPPASIRHDERLSVRVALSLDGLDPDDVIVECLVGLQPNGENFKQLACYRLEAAREKTDKGETIFQASFAPPMPGLQHYYLRTYPYHRLLSHPFELGFMKWI